MPDINILAGRIIACVVDQHDPMLVLLAASICTFAAYTAFSLFARARSSRREVRAIWTVAAAIALGIGVWATHFIAMLGFEPHHNMPFSLWPTLLSIAIAIAFNGWGFRAAADGRRLFGGVLIGAGVAAMHYVGMEAISAHGAMHYDQVLVALSLAAGMLSTAALASAARAGGFNQAAAVLLLTVSVCGLHFIGMASLHLAPQAVIPVAVTGVPAAVLAITIAMATCFILALGLGGVLLDDYLSRRQELDAERIRASEARFRALANATFEGIILHEDGVIRDVNEAMCNLLGVTRDEIVGTWGPTWVAPHDHPLVQEYLSGSVHSPMELELIARNGELIPVETLLRPLEGNNLRIVAMRDLRERKQAQEHIHHIAHHDTLTGLPNRMLLLDRLGQAIAAASRSGSQLAVLCIDLDRFKNVNDLLGHWGGDELLRQTAERLLQIVRTQDTVARLGGDEFAIVLVGAAVPHGPVALAERLVNGIAEPFVLGDQQVLVGASIGVALYPTDGQTAETLLRAADTALYRAKERGRNGFCFFEAEMNRRLEERAQLEQDLRIAIGSEQLALHYQPLVDCHNGDINGYEALLRWQHPLRGAISPAEFIPLAEESGLILSLGAWVLTTACRDALEWPRALHVAVNLSPAQFRHGDLANDILTILNETGLPTSRLEIEITESVLISDTEATLQTLKRLKGAGVRIALDDFGTGYSSLSYLQRFPFDKIKIDRSFIWEMERNPDSMAIVRAVIALGHSLQIKVTAEGVETTDQLSLLREEHCDQVQGYLLGRPAPLPATTAPPRLVVGGTTGRRQMH